MNWPDYALKPLQQVSDEPLALLPDGRYPREAIEPRMAVVFKTVELPTIRVYVETVERRRESRLLVALKVALKVAFWAAVLAALIVALPPILVALDYAWRTR